MTSADTVETAAGPADARPREAASRRRRRGLAAEWLPLAAFYLVLGCALTWPLAGRMSSGFYGFGNDNWGGIWFGKWIHDAFWGPANTGFSREIQFPFGFHFDDRYIQPYDRAIDIVFGGIGGGLFAYNLMVLISFPMAGLAMYALARYVTGNRPAAVVAGVIFAASPFHLAMSMQYPPMASIYCAPLLVLAVLNALKRRRARDAAWAGAALALVWLTSYYYGWFAIWFVLLMLAGAGLVGAIRGARTRQLGASVREGASFILRRGTLAAAVFAIVSVPLLLPLITKVLSNQGKYARQEADVAENAVRPWQYILPPHDNPVFGRYTSSVITRHTGIVPIYEQSVYLGVLPALLALGALVLWRRRDRRWSGIAAPLIAGTLFCVALTLGPAIPVNVTSIGDWLSPGTNPQFPGPVKLLYALSPNFRYYGRAFVFVSVALAVFAAVGFTLLSARLASRWRASWVPWAAAAFTIAVVLVEFANRPPTRFVDLKTPAWVTAVKQLPKGAPIIEYPVADYSSPRSLQYVYWQTRHRHPTVNPPETPQSQDFLRSLDDPDSFLTGRELARAGVRYVVVHTRLGSPTFPPYQPATQTDQLPASAGARNPWLQRYKTTSDAVLYRVLSKPKSVEGATVGFGAGWGDLEIDPTGRWRWMRNGDSEMSIFAARAYPHARLAFNVTSFVVPRKMDVAVDGRPIAHLTVPPNAAVRFDAPVRLARGLHKAQIITDPGPVVVDSVLHNSDLRAIAVRVQVPKIILPRGR